MDGSEAEILIRQDYRWRRDRPSRRSRPPFPQFALHSYRESTADNDLSSWHHPEPAETIQHWRELFKERHGEDPYFFMAQTFTDFDPKQFGCDGAVEFPPHRLLSNVNPRNSELTLYDQAFAGTVYNYDDVVQASASVAVPPFPLIRTVFPSWDNDARRQGRGVVFATPLRTNTRHGYPRRFPLLANIPYSTSSL